VTLRGQYLSSVAKWFVLERAIFTHSLSGRPGNSDGVVRFRLRRGPLAATAAHYCRGAGKSLAQPTSRCILFDCQNISFDGSLVVYINSTNIPPIMIINKIYEHHILLLL
jgi:hypothetical protein